MPAAPDAEEEDDGLVFQLGYASAATRPFTDDELDELLTTSRANNAKRGVSGLLLYHEGSFLQVLEGERSLVEALFDKIAEDPRHTDKLLLFRNDGVQRCFDHWTMGFHRLRKGDAPPGLNRFLETGATGLAADDGENIRNVLLGFRDGRWRRTVAS
ncbi:MAG: BLUF domain-containing protein [Actinomycetota bacterium]